MTLRGWLALNAETMDSMIDHEDGCGDCEYRRIRSEVAADMLAALKEGDDGGPINSVKMLVYEHKVWCRWRETKYFKLHESEREAGRDPAEAFRAQGWEP